MMEKRTTIRTCMMVLAFMICVAMTAAVFTENTYAAGKPGKIKKATIKIHKVIDRSATIKYGKSTGAKNYQIAYKAVSGKWKYKKTSKRKAVLKNLKPGTKYNVKVRGLSRSRSKGKWSSIVSFRTQSAGGNDEEIDPNAPQATDVQYIKKNGKRVGIKSFTIKPYTYCNLSQDRNVNPDGESTLELNDARLRDITASQIFPRWGVIAEGIFRDQASQLVTIEGSGMMSSDKSAGNSFDRQFSYSKKGVNTGYSKYDWAVSDLAAELAREGNDQKGDINWDERRSTGIVAINNLAGARRLMGQELRNCADDNDITVDEFLGNGVDKSDQKYRLPDLQNEDTGGGFASVVTCVNRAGASGDYDYASFGIAVYDFDISPVAARDLQYIEAAADITDGEDILMGRKGDDVEETGISFKNKDRKAVTTYIQNKTPVEDTFQSALKNNTTEQNTITTQDTQQWGMSQSVGLNVNVGGISGKTGGVIPRVTITTNFTWNEMWSSMKGKSNSKTVGDEKSINNTLKLPGYTVAKITQNVNDKSTRENYQQPYILNYKVAVFAMSGDYYNGSSGGISNSRYDKQWMNVLFDGSDQESASGCCALSSLFNRAIVNQNTQGYDGAKGKYRSWCDKGEWVSSNKINWKNVASELTDTKENRSSHSIISSRTNKKSTLQDLATELPLLEKGHLLESSQVNMSSSVDQIVALYPLDSVVVAKDAKELTAKPNETFHLAGIELQGLNTRNADFYGFRDSWGEWKLYDKDKGVIEDGSDEDSNHAKGEITSGKFTLINDEILGTQSVKIDHTAKNGDGVYLKWIIDSGDDTKIVSNENLISGEKPYMTAEERAKVSTPVIRLSVDDESSDAASIDVSGEYTGHYDKEINLGQVLQASVLDTTDRVTGFPIYWEDKGYGGITVSDNGDTRFSVEGYYYVRAYTYNRSNKKIYSEWVRIHATDKEELTSIRLLQPRFDADDLVIDRVHPAREINLASCIEYCDQYGNRYDAYYDDERAEDKWVTRDVPEIEFNVDNSYGARVSDNGMMTVTQPGTYKVTATAYERKEDGTKQYLDYKINTITFYFTCQNWIGAIRLSQPAMSAKDLQLQSTDDVVAIRSMKDLLVYYDQNSEPWTGAGKPEVRFSVDAGEKYAEMKEDNLFIYRPGVYKVTATASSTAGPYEIEPILIKVTENEKLVINAIDPPNLRITEKTPDPAVDINRCVEYSTQFGNKWNGTDPAVEFSLDKDTEGATLQTRTYMDDKTGEILGEYTALVATLPGTYHVHVKVQKASQYPEEIDDIIVKARLYQAVYSLGLDMKGEYDDNDPYIDHYTDADQAEVNLEKRIIYYGQNNEVLKGGYVDAPATSLGFWEDKSAGISRPSAKEAVIKDGILIAYEPGDYWVCVDSSDKTVDGAHACVTVADRTKIHHIGDWEDATDPSVAPCLQDSVKVKRCKGHDLDGDGNIDETCDVEIIDRQPPQPHKLVKTEGKDATCGAAGVEEYWTCETCGKFFTDEGASEEIAKPVVIPATGEHAWSREGSDARYIRNPDGSYAENANGPFIRYDKKCRRCGTSGEPEYVIVHNYGDWKYLPEASDGHSACEHETERVRTCKGHDLDADGVIDEACTMEIRDSVPAGGHDWNTIYEVRQEGSVGVFEHKCKTCGAIRDTKRYLSNRIGTSDPATCTEEGFENVNRKAGGTIVAGSRITIPALGHVYRKYKVIQEPTEDTRGVEVLFCDRCGDILQGSEQEVPSLSEDMVEFYKKKNQ